VVADKLHGTRARDKVARNFEYSERVIIDYNEVKENLEMNPR
jgi:hypothetical protein